LNFLFTKKLALEAAFTMVDKGKSREEAREQIKEKTGNILAGDKAGLYSNKIRQKQLREMDLLIEHYCRLLNAEGKDYPSLVKNAYPSREEYVAFLEELEQAEREVYQAAHQTVKSSSSREIASKMEEATARVRRAELDRLFS
jgi:predicted RNase H-like HicB family nuclease